MADDRMNPACIYCGAPKPPDTSPTCSEDHALALASLRENDMAGLREHLRRAKREEKAA